MEASTCLFAVIITVLIVVVTWVVQYYQIEHRTAPWKGFAVSKGLTYIPGDLFSAQKPFVRGTYKGRSVTLKTVEVSGGKSSQTHTSVTVALYLSASGADQADKVTNLRTHEIISLLDPNQLCYRLNGSLTILPGELDYRESGILTDTTQLTLIMDCLVDIATGYPKIAGLGSEVIPTLRAAVDYEALLSEVVRQLLIDISEHTSRYLQAQMEQIRCADCLTTFCSYKESVGFMRSVSYVGCRLCKQSRRHYQAKRVVLTLDSAAPKEIRQGQNTLQINWLQRRTLCDFNEVHILNATDEDAERLAVQIGNDTDPERTELYEQMTCTVDPTCPLSENTLRILRRTFGEVVVG